MAIKISKKIKAYSVQKPEDKAKEAAAPVAAHGECQFALWRFELQGLRLRVCGEHPGLIARSAELL